MERRKPEILIIIRCCDFLRVKTRISSKYGLPSQPRLVDIIAAVPPQYKKVSISVARLPVVLLVKKSQVKICELKCKFLKAIWNLQLHVFSSHWSDKIYLITVNNVSLISQYCFCYKMDKHGKFIYVFGLLSSDFVTKVKS